YAEAPVANAVEIATRYKSARPLRAWPFCVIGTVPLSRCVRTHLFRDPSWALRRDWPARRLTRSAKSGWFPPAIRKRTGERASKEVQITKRPPCRAADRCPDSGCGGWIGTNDLQVMSLTS